MKTLTLKQAAELLQMNAEVLRRRATQGDIPGANIGRRWIFIEEDLTDYLRSLYPKKRSGSVMSISRDLGDMKCFTKDPIAPTGTQSSVSKERAYADLLNR